MKFEVIECMKQNPASVDCGIMMLNSIERHSQGIDLKKKFSAEGFRAKLMSATVSSGENIKNNFIF